MDTPIDIIRDLAKERCQATYKHMNCKRMQRKNPCPRCRAIKYLKESEAIAKGVR